MRIAVVGAGISGLVAARRLTQARHTVTVYESSATPGGRMSTRNVQGLPVDLGVNVLLENYTRLKVLAGELGLLEQWFEIQSGPGGVLRAGELTSFSPHNLLDVLRYRGLSLPARLQLVGYFLRARQQGQDLDFFDLSQGPDTLDAVDAYSVLHAELGQEVADFVVDPFVRTFHFHSSKRISAKYFEALAALFMQKGGFITHAFKGHMQQLPDALAAGLDVRFSAPVTRVDRQPGGVRVHVDDQTAQSFDAVVLATPARPAARLLKDATAEEAQLLASVQYAPTLSVSYAVERSVLADFEGIWVPFSESAIISECSNEGCKGSGDSRVAVLNFGLHEEAAGPLMQEPDSVIFRLVANEWGRLSPGLAGKLTPLHAQRWPMAMPVYAPGYLQRVKHFLTHHQGSQHVYLCGDYLNHPWVEGSIRCGEKVAALILANGG